MTYRKKEKNRLPLLLRDITLSCYQRRVSYRKIFVLTRGAEVAELEQVKKEFSTLQQTNERNQKSKEELRAQLQVRLEVWLLRLTRL